MKAHLYIKLYMKKTFYLTYSILVISVVILICILFPYNNHTPASTISKFASLQIQIKDEYTNEKINNATICILNVREYYTSNKNGLTVTIKIPLFSEYKMDDYYLYHLLIYKNGYNDFLYLNLKLKENQKRADLIIPLIPIINESDIKTTIFFEPPYNQTINQIIKENKK